jgi:hypothetical protein
VNSTGTPWKPVSSTNCPSRRTASLVVLLKPWMKIRSDRLPGGRLASSRLIAAM